MQSMNKLPLSTFAAIGIAFVFSAFTFSSWVFYPTAFSPFNNWLSDLGNYGDNPNGAVFYNLGCILTGIIAIFFIFGLREWYTDDSFKKILLMFSQTVGFLSAIFLIMIGIFSEDSPPWHSIFSISFFASFSLFLFIFSLSVYTHEKFHTWIGALAIVVVMMDIAFAFQYNETISEWIVVFSYISIVLLIGWNMSVNWNSADKVAKNLK